MRALMISLTLALVAFPLAAQPQRVAPRRPVRVDAAELAVKQAAEQLAEERKVYERDMLVLKHLRAADEALIDDMQRANALQKAHEEVEKAYALGGDMLVMQGVGRMRRELTDARRSFATADFGRLRGLLREHALAPAARVVARNALKLEEDMLQWLKVQELISVHLRTMSEITGESLRAAQQ